MTVCCALFALPNSAGKIIITAEFYFLAWYGQSFSDTQKKPPKFSNKGGFLMCV